MLHADSVASRRVTFIWLPLRKLSWCASPGASERNITFWSFSRVWFAGSYVSSRMRARLLDGL